MRIEKLSPAYKDYLWGGNRLKEVSAKTANLKSPRKAGSFPSTPTVKAQYPAVKTTGSSCRNISIITVKAYLEKKQEILSISLCL